MKAKVGTPMASRSPQILRWDMHFACKYFQRESPSYWFSEEGELAPWGHLPMPGDFSSGDDWEEKSVVALRREAGILLNTAQCARCPPPN